MDWTQVVYVTAWHRAFFQPLLPHSQDAHTCSTSVAQLLRLLEACGYTKASLWYDKLCEEGKAEAIDWSSIRTSLQVLTNVTTNNKTVWPQRFFALCALHTLQDCKDTSAPDTRGCAHDLHELLTQSTSSTMTSTPQNTGDAAAAAAETTQQEQTWWQAQVQAVLSHTNTNSTEADAASSSLLFSLAATSPTATITTTASHTAHKAELMQVWQEARLYGMLTLATSFTQVSSLARLLAIYVMQEHAALAHGLFGDTAHHAHTTHANATRNGAEQSPSVRRRQCMRVRGLVCGVAEYALHVSQAEAGRVRYSLRTLQENTNGNNIDNTSNTDRAQLLDVLPRVGEEATIRTTAVLLLIQVAEQLSTLDKLLHLSPSAASSSSSSSSSMAEEWSVSVLHTMHELLFTLVLGAGTCAMPNRPAVPARSSNSNTSASTNTNSSNVSYLALPYSVTRRALTLAEADAFVQCILPALLQQLGYEWPWSAMLRHCRALDRLTAPNGCIAAQMPVRWTSRILIDSLLLALRPRTYLERLQQVLPPSYDRILDALGFAVVHTGNEDTEGKKDRARAAMLFALPPYYAEAGAVLVEYLTRTSVSGWTEAELERLLVQSTASLPMLVQLRALAPRKHTAGDHITGVGGLYGARIIEQDNRNEEEAGQEEDAEYELTTAQVHALETRYRAEVLLVSLVVYTQLRTASQVQHAMRQAAPLLTRLLLELHDFYRLAGLQPFLVRRTQQQTTAATTTTTNNSNSKECVVAAGFTRVAELLMNRVGYQFYPLEWLPSYAQAYYDEQIQQQHAITNTREVGMAMPYSVYAAVGHQLGLTLRSVPQGSAGAMSQRLPAGPRASLLTAADTPASLLLLSSQHSEEGGGEKNEDDDVVARRANKAWECVERFVQVGMLDVYLQSRTASWELEGPLAVASTRRLTPQHNMSNNNNAGAVQSGIASLLSLEPLTYSEDLTAHEKNSTGNDVATKEVQPVWQPKLWHLLCTQRSSKNKKKSTNTGGGGEMSAQERAGVRALRRVLLRSGAASFADVPQAADFAATLAQCFLPSSVSSAAQCSSNNKPNKLLTQRLLQGAHEWCRARVANASDTARLRTLAQQLGQSSNTGNSEGPCGRLARLYNSGTFDASALARDVLREVPARLRAKLEQRMQEEQEYHDMNDAYDDEEEESSSSSSKPKNAATTVVPDPLLMHQWSTWQQMLHSLGLSSESNAGEEEEDMNSVMPSVTQWLWYSSYVQGEL